MAAGDAIEVHWALDRARDLEQKTLEKLSQQKSGLMDDLLTGRVRATPRVA